jgi:hypothetical protein
MDGVPDVQAFYFYQTRGVKECSTPHSTIGGSAKEGSVPWTMFVPTLVWSLPLNFLWFWHVLYLSILHTRTRGVKGREGGGERGGEGTWDRREESRPLAWVNGRLGVNWVVGVGIGVDIGVVGRRLRYPGQLDPTVILDLDPCVQVLQRSLV